MIYFIALFLVAKYDEYDARDSNSVCNDFLNNAHSSCCIQLLIKYSCNTDAYSSSLLRFKFDISVLTKLWFIETNEMRVQKEQDMNG